MLTTLKSCRMMALAFNGNWFLLRKLAKISIRKL